MITDKQIEEAQESIFEEEFLGNGENVIYKDDEGNEDYTEERYDDEQIKEAIKLGAHWAIEQTLKNLWHPASEEPKCHSYIMFKTTINNGFGTEYIDCSWKTLARCLQITQWLYVEDLFPKEGGEQ